MHARLPGSTDILRLVIKEHTFLRIDLKTLAESLINSNIRLEKMHLMGDEIAVEQTERSGKLLHDIKDFCRPVGQTEQAIALGFERHHPIVDTGISAVKISV